MGRVCPARVTKMNALREILRAVVEEIGERRGRGDSEREGGEGRGKRGEGRRKRRED